MAQSEPRSITGGGRSLQNFAWLSCTARLQERLEVFSLGFMNVEVRLMPDVGYFCFFSSNRAYF